MHGVDPRLVWRTALWKRFCCAQHKAHRTANSKCHSESVISHTSLLSPRYRQWGFPFSDTRNPLMLYPVSIFHFHVVASPAILHFRPLHNCYHVRNQTHTSYHKPSYSMSMDNATRLHGTITNFERHRFLMFHPDEATLSLNDGQTSYSPFRVTVTTATLPKQAVFLGDGITRVSPGLGRTLTPVETLSITDTGVLGHSNSASLVEYARWIGLDPSETQVSHFSHQTLTHPHFAERQVGDPWCEGISLTMRASLTGPPLISQGQASTVVAGKSRYRRLED
jgi:hypothetical protein